MLWAVFLLIALLIAAGAVAKALSAGGDALERLEDMEPLVCAHCGEDPDPDGEWFARNVMGWQ